MYSRSKDDYDEEGITKAQYSLTPAEAEKLVDNGKLYKRYDGIAIVGGWDHTENGDMYLYDYLRYDFP